MRVAFGREHKVSLELTTMSTAMQLLLRVTAIIKFGLEPMDPILKNMADAWMKLGHLCNKI